MRHHNRRDRPTIGTTTTATGLLWQPGQLVGTHQALFHVKQSVFVKMGKMGKMGKRKRGKRE